MRSIQESSTRNSTPVSNATLAAGHAEPDPGSSAPPPEGRALPLSDGDQEQSAARHCLENFLDCHASVIHDFRHLPVEQSGLMSDLGSRAAEFTHFDDLYDTLLYSRTITRALDCFDEPLSSSTQQNGDRNQDERESQSGQADEGDLIIDLRAGSSIPTLLALSRRNLKHVRVLAVDIDPEAEHIGRANAERFGFGANYRFLHAPIESVLKELGALLLRERASRTLIVSNPPFIPVPPKARDHHLVPVDGGEDGSHYIQNILTRHYPPHTTLALVWGSLTSPMEVLPLIERDYEVSSLEAMRTRFAKYTSLPAVREHLYSLREQGRTVFDNDAFNGDSQLVMGAVLRPRKPS